MVGLLKRVLALELVLMVHWKFPSFFWRPTLTSPSLMAKRSFERVMFMKELFLEQGFLFASCLFPLEQSFLFAFSVVF